MLPITSTYILTPELSTGGWKLMSELEPGDPFYIFNKETKELKIEHFDGFKYKAHIPISKLDYVLNDIFSYGKKDNYWLEKYYPFPLIGYPAYKHPGTTDNSNKYQFTDADYLKILLYILGTFKFAHKMDPETYGNHMYQIDMDKLKNNPLVPDNIAFLRSIYNISRYHEVPVRELNGGYKLILNLSLIDNNGNIPNSITTDYTKDLYKWIDSTRPYIDSEYANHFLKSVRSIMMSITGYYDVFTISYTDACVFQNLGILSGKVPLNKIHISDILTNDEVEKNFIHLMFELDFLKEYKDNTNNNYDINNQNTIFNPKDRFDIWEYLDRVPPEDEYIEVANLLIPNSFNGKGKGNPGIIIKQSLMDILGVAEETPPYVVGGI